MPGEDCLPQRSIVQCRLKVRSIDHFLAPICLSVPQLCVSGIVFRISAKSL